MLFLAGCRVGAGPSAVGGEASHAAIGAADVVSSPDAGFFGTNEEPSSGHPNPLLGSPMPAARSADAPDEAIAAPPSGPRSEPLSCGLHNPMPGGFTAGYPADTGLDIAGIKMPVFAIASGWIDYAEAGHSLWTSPRDTDLAIRIELDEPLEFEGREVTHVWYAHLSALAFEQPEGAPKRRRVSAGEWLGTSGVANGSWHLHMGLLLDGDVSQGWGTYLLEDDARAVLCGLRARQRLPASPK